MNPTTAISQNFNFDTPCTIFSDLSSTDPAFYFERQDALQLMDLYQKPDDEPDFDCEFLQGIDYNYTENTIDLEPEEEQADEYNDNQWDADIYDPYLESMYY